MSQTRVLVFGSFDGLHEGHRNFFAQARALGDYVIVVVSRDSYIRTVKKRTPRKSEQERVQDIKKLGVAHEIILGEEAPGYNLLQSLSFDVLAVGYDQEPSDSEIHQLLIQIGKESVSVVRLQPYMPEIYKSTLLRGTGEET